MIWITYDTKTGNSNLLAQDLQNKFMRAGLPAVITAIGKHEWETHRPTPCKFILHIQPTYEQPGRRGWYLSEPAEQWLRQLTDGHTGVRFGILYTGNRTFGGKAFAAEHSVNTFAIDKGVFDGEPLRLVEQAGGNHDLDAIVRTVKTYVLV